MTVSHYLLAHDAVLLILVALIVHLVRRNYR
jgi:hypothetical protein